MLDLTVRQRIIYSFLGLTTASLLFIGMYLLYFFHHQNLELKTAELMTNAQIAENMLENDLLAAGHTDAVRRTVARLGEKVNLRVTVIAPDGSVVADSDGKPGDMENHLGRPEIRQALSGRFGTATRKSDTLNESMLYAALPVYHGGRIVGVIRAASTLEPIEAGFYKVKITVIAAVCLTAFLTILLSVWSIRHYTGPIETITAGAAKIAAGDLSHRINIAGDDELGALAHTLNTLAANLDDKIREINAEAQKMSLILEHMDNAVLLLDPYGYVTAANPQARRTFAIHDRLLGKHSIGVIGHSALSEASQAAVTSGRPQSIQLTLNAGGRQKIFQVSFAPITDAAKNVVSVLSVFHDITAIRKVYDRQVEFVANASHELATPLTSIKGFSETLLDGALDEPELRRRFVAIIHNEAERMRRLIKDLLQLAKLDSEEYRRQIALTPVLLRPIFETVERELAPQYQAKNQRLVLRCPPGDTPALAHYDWLKQIVVNLTENAIKYTPTGGEITLSYQTEGDQIHVAVTDNGIGVPPADIPFIFDRFYRVDKARSRAAGGSGLGLSLVKFIVEMFGGQIRVHSSPGRGAAFTFTLPAARDPDKEQP